jgi:hypothetical protein
MEIDAQRVVEISTLILTSDRTNVSIGTKCFSLSLVNELKLLKDIFHYRLAYIDK